jgi:GNAT superfamily N-acetyltransferase
MPLTSIEFRPGSSEDGEQVAALYGAVRAGLTYLPRLHTAEEDRNYFAAQLDEHGSLVAVSPTMIVAFAIFGDGWLHHLYVDERHQGRGIGSELVSRVKALTRGALELWTFQMNSGARRFYERHGFVVVEETDGSGNDERLPDVRYRWCRV